MEPLAGREYAYFAHHWWYRPSPKDLESLSRVRAVSISGDRVEIKVLGVSKQRYGAESWADLVHSEDSHLWVSPRVLICPWEDRFKWVQTFNEARNRDIESRISRRIPSSGRSRWRRGKTRWPRRQELRTNVKQKLHKGEEL